MRIRLSARTIAAVLSSTAFLAACGGGGGGGGSSPPPPPTGTLALTSTNASKAAGLAFSSTDIRSLGSTGASTVIGVVTGTGGRIRMLDLLSSQALKWGAGAGSTTGGLPLPVGVTTTPNVRPAEQCITGNVNSGTITATINEVGTVNNTLDAGESASILFTNCVLDATSGDVANGTIVLALNNVTGTIPAVANQPFTVNMTFTFQSFTVNQGSLAGPATTANGDIGFTLARAANTTVQTGTFAGSSLAIAGGGDTQTVTAYSFSFDKDAGTGVYHEWGSGTVASTVLGGTVGVLIPSTAKFTGTDPGFPSSGTMNVYGSGGSQLVVSTLSATQVQLTLNGTLLGNVNWSGL